jgi:hypothetical protein
VPSDIYLSHFFWNVQILSVNQANMMMNESVNLTDLHVLVLEDDYLIAEVIRK